MKHNTRIIAVLICATLFRAIYLNAVPPALSNDEINAAYNSYALAKTGKDIAGQPWYKAAFITPQHYTMTEFLAVFAVPWIKMTDLSMSSVRIWYALLSIVTILLTYKIAKLLFDKKIAILSAILMTISPWHLMMSRIGYDGIPALLFLLIGTYIMLTYNDKKIIWASIPFITAFHTYHAIKIMVLPYVLVLATYLWKKDKNDANKNKKSVIALIVIVGIWIGIYTPIFLSQSAAASRLTELKKINTEEIDTIRASSLLPRTITDKAFNKITASVNTYLINLCGFFDPGRMLLSGDRVEQFTTWKTGLLYPIDGIMLLIGGTTLWIRNKKTALLIGSFFMVSLLPAILNTNSQTYALRAISAIPWIAMVIGYGCIVLIEYTQEIKKIMIAMVAVVYTCFVSYFLIVYFGLFPISSARAYLQPNRIAVAYINKLPQSTKVKMIGNEPRNYFVGYSFYNKIDPAIIQKQWQEKTFVHANKTMTSICPDQIEQDIIYIIHKDKQDCVEKLKQKNYITEITQDYTQTWMIFNDTICKNIVVSDTHFIRANKLSEWSEIENNDAHKLCRKWLMKK